MAKDKFRPLPIAEKILRNLHVRRLTAHNDSQLLSFDANSGLYSFGEMEIRLVAQQICGVKVTEHQVKEVIHAVRRNAHLVQTSQLNDPARQIVVFRNGIRSIKTLRPKKPRPDLLYTIGIPHRYDSRARCPAFNRFMGQILPGDVHQLVGEIMGYLLLPWPALRKFFVFVGIGANGKSTLLKVIEAMLGNSNVSHHSLHGLAENRFAVYDLFGKLANIYADLDARDVKSAGLLKQIVAGDPLFYEQKYHTPFGGPVTARLVFSANRMPLIQDDSEAISDRLILVEFPHRFVGKKDDVHLIDRLTTKEEIEGVIARWAVPGLRSLLSQKQFSVPDRSRELLADYRLSIDPVGRFISERVEAVPDASITRQSLFSACQEWFIGQGVSAPTQHELNQRIAEAFGISRDADHRETGSRKRIWQGLRLRAGEGSERQSADNADALQKAPYQDAGVETLGFGLQSQCLGLSFGEPRDTNDPGQPLEKEHQAAT